MTAQELINAVREQVAVISQARGVTMAEALAQARVLVTAPDHEFATDALSVASTDDSEHGWSVVIDAL